MNLKRVCSSLLITLTLLGTILAMFGTLPSIPIVAEVHAAPPNNPAILGLFSELKKSNVVVDSNIRPGGSGGSIFKLDVNITDAGLIKGFDIKDKNSYLFHAGTKRQDGKILTNGGRVLGVTALGGTLEQAIKNAYSSVDTINWPSKYFRTDIGKKGLT